MALTVIGLLGGVFTAPVTVKAYPESLEWWSGQIVGLDGETVKNVLFFAAIALAIGAVAGPPLVRRARGLDEVEVEGAGTEPLATRLRAYNFELSKWLRIRGTQVPGDQWVDVAEGDDWDKVQHGDRAFQLRTRERYIEDFRDRAHALALEAVGTTDLTNAEVVNLVTAPQSTADLWAQHERFKNVIKQLERHATRA